MKYIAIRPKSDSDDWQDKPPIAGATIVYEPENRVEKTGLLDADGTPLYRVKEKIGFR